MDTTQWGPSGWPLFHSIAYYYDHKEDEQTKNEDINHKDLKFFFTSMKHVLPCIYCRRSYTEYIKETPFPLTDIFRWSYDIHNKVNNKLRKQGYNHKPDPSFETVKKDYVNFFKKRKNCTEMGWKFLYSIIFNYDEGISLTRKKGYLIFFYLLGKVLPNKKSREKYQHYMDKNPIEDCLDTSDHLKKWMYSLEKTFKSKCCSYKKRCKSIEKYKVNKCSGKTCRNT
jgi:hypothetical protein